NVVSLIILSSGGRAAGLLAYVTSSDGKTVLARSGNRQRMNPSVPVCMHVRGTMPWRHQQALITQSSCSCPTFVVITLLGSRQVVVYVHLAHQVISKDATSECLQTVRCIDDDSSMHNLIQHRSLYVYTDICTDINKYDPSN
ncbi:hypothetical protein Vretifemale_15731, partial [Volvox reticuliferus]